jgi:diguanylate cyclase (GGDEF)-like protein
MRILLVDSSRTVLHIVTDQIRLGGHEVQAFTDSREALRCLMADSEVRTLITSTAPHGMPGVQLCAEARAFAGQRRPLYIILMSSNDERQSVVMALDNGADDFMHKPPIADELRARLRAADRMTSMQRELIRSATTDFLTGVLTRRAFFDHAEQWCAQSAIEMSAVMFDIDHFKRINDTYGHQAGDMVLRAVTKRTSGIGGEIGRLGGEEFCLLAECDLYNAGCIAEQLRASVEQMCLTVNDATISVTSSFGVAEWLPGDTLDSLLARADAALYQAKETGRNRVVGADRVVPREDECRHRATRQFVRAVRTQ